MRRCEICGHVSVRDYSQDVTTTTATTTLMSTTDWKSVMELFAFSQASSQSAFYRALNNLQPFPRTLRKPIETYGSCNFARRTNPHFVGHGCSFWFPRNFPARRVTMRFDIGDPMICLSIPGGWSLLFRRRCIRCILHDHLQYPHSMD